MALRPENAHHLLLFPAIVSQLVSMVATQAQPTCPSYSLFARSSNALSQISVAQHPCRNLREVMTCGIDGFFTRLAEISACEKVVIPRNLAGRSRGFREISRKRTEEPDYTRDGAVIRRPGNLDPTQVLMTDGMERVPGEELVRAFDAELFQPASEGARMKAELPGGAEWPINPPICLLKGPSNMRMFQIVQSRGRLCMPVGTGGCEQARVDLHLGRVRQDDGPLDHVLKFSDVSGPGVLNESLHGVVFDIPTWAFQIEAVLLDEMAR